MEVRTRTMVVPTSPRFYLGEPVAIKEYHERSTYLHEVMLASTRIIVGHACRATNDLARLEFVQAALKEPRVTSLDDSDKANAFFSAGQHARAEEFILGRVIVAHAASFFLFNGFPENIDALAASIHDLNSSITHGPDAVFAVASRARAGIDYEKVQPREPSWEKKMDPRGDAARIKASFTNDESINHDVATTIAWCCKEAATKVVGRDLKVIPGINIEPRGTHLELLVPGEQKTIRAWIARHNDGILAIALGEKQ